MYPRSRIRGRYVIRLLHTSALLRGNTSLSQRLPRAFFCAAIFHSEEQRDDNFGV